MNRTFFAILRLFALVGLLSPLALAGPVPVIFDTDMGNDVDDVMALCMLHSLQRRRLCELLAVTVSKDHPLAAAFTDVVNTFEGAPRIPIGVVREGPTRDEGKFLHLANMTGADGNIIYPHSLKAGNIAPEAVSLLRRTLAGQADGSVVMIQVGFFTNLSRLLDSKPDEFSNLTGEELVKHKVRLLSLMAGNFSNPEGKGLQAEYNVGTDVNAARLLNERWPTKRVWSGFEVGTAVTFPHESIAKDLTYVEHHPLREAYALLVGNNDDRPTWDATAVLEAVLPDRGYFELSEPGNVSVREDGVTTFSKKKDGPDRFLVLKPENAARVPETIVMLATEPPAGHGK